MLLSFLVRTSLGVSVAAYAVGILLAGTVTALGSYRVISAVLVELAPPARPNVAVAAVAPDRPHPSSRASNKGPAQFPEPQASMTPLRAGMTHLPTGADMPRLVQPAYSGSSSWYWDRPSRRDREYNYNYGDDEEEEERPRYAGTFRTMCVRLCDGYYFPISFSATRDRFERDAKICESSCGGQARLFTYRNPGADVEDMVDLRGQPYRQLSTAFLYRNEYVAACRCNPNPWDAEARDRHRMYALVAAKRKGDKQAAVELDALTAKMKLDRPAQVAMPIEDPAADSTAGKVRAGDRPRGADRADDKTGRMGLGARTPRETRERPSRTEGRDSEWMGRALGLGY